MEYAYFISDDKIKSRIDNSIEYILALYAEVHHSSKKTYREETYRVIILYCVSIIEALLLVIYTNKLDSKIYKTEYKEPHKLSENYQNKDGTIVVAVQKDVPKEEKEIGLRELVAFLKKNKILKKETASRITAINDRRNTFHFHKKGKTACTVQDVEEALDLINTVLRGTYVTVR
jgi:hypothetical protein